MSKITIIEPNTNDTEEVKAYMIKGEPGDDGVSPTITTSRTGKITTITIEDAEGTKEADINDGFDPTIEVSKTGGITTLTIVDAEGTKTATINDGETANIIDSETLGDNTKETYSGRVLDNKTIPSNSKSNTRLGDNALTKFELDPDHSNYGKNNTAIGNEALSENTTGCDNTALGSYSLDYNTTGYDNTGVGYRSLRVNTTGSKNTAVGVSALWSNTTGDDNTAVGDASLMYNTTGSQNTGLGVSALVANTTGSQNTGFGAFALYQNTTGTGNTGVGYLAGSDNTTYNYSTCLGYNSQVTGDRQVQLGDSLSSVYSYSALNIRSDKRDKKDIEDTDLGLEFINKLRPVKFKWNFRDGSYEGKRFHQGLIAQEVKEVMDELNVDFAGYQDHKVNGGEDILTLGYEELITPLIKAVQEQQKIIEDLKEKVEKLSSKK